MKKGLRVRVNSFDKLSDIFNNYDFIHFGSETCENLVFYYNRYLKKLLKLDKKIVLSIPPLSQKTLKYLISFLEDIKKDITSNSFIFSLNDFGTFAALRRMFSKDFEIIIGRHFTKYFFSLTRNILNFYSIYSLRLMNKNSIKCFEISSFEEFPDHTLDIIKNNRIEFEFIVHHPFSLLSTARNCVIGFRDISPGDDIKGIECDRSCLYSDYEVYIKKLNTKIFLCENSVYKKVGSNIFINSNQLSDINVKAVVYDFLGGI